MGRRNKRYVLFSLSMVVLVVLRGVVAQDPVSSAVRRVLNPVSGFFFSRAVSQENSAIETEDATGLAVDQLKVENERLRRELGLLPQAGGAVVGADVIGKNVENYRRFIRINRGANDGVKTGQPVLSTGRLVGMVKEAYDTSSNIQLVSDPEFRIAVTVEGTDLSGLVSSSAGGTVIDLVPTNPQALEDKLVVTNGLGGVLPPGLLLGRVGDDVTEEGGVYRTYVLRQAVRVDRLRTVSVLVGQ